MVAYSNASTYQASKILEDLEYFRAAALRLPGIELPSDALKTLFIIPATATEFSEFSENSNSVGFAQPLEDRKAIVFRATGRTHTSEYILYLEYEPTLQFFQYSAAVSQGIHETDNPLAVIDGNWGFRISVTTYLTCIWNRRLTG